MTSANSRRRRYTMCVYPSRLVRSLRRDLGSVVARCYATRGVTSARQVAAVCPKGPTRRVRGEIRAQPHRRLRHLLRLAETPEQAVVRDHVLLLLARLLERRRQQLG